MIELKIEDYCQNCDRFEADVQIREMYTMNMDKYVETTIKCSRRRTCHDIMEYIREQMKGDKQCKN